MDQDKLKGEPKPTQSPPVVVGEPIKKEKCLVKTARCLKPLFKDRIIVTSSRCTIWCNFVLFLVLIIIGVIIRASGNNNTEFRIRFDDKCKSSLTSCDFDIIVREDTEGPFYVYVHFTNFHINHRQVMRSFSSDQLRGLPASHSTISTTCGTKLRNKDLNITTYAFATTTPVNTEELLTPCGILPSLIPTDRISFGRYGDLNVVTSIPLDTDKINYPNLKGNKFKITDETRSKLWIDIEDPRFIEWMKAPMNSNFYKLYGVINTKLTKGTYKLSIIPDLRLSELSKIEKEIFITNLSWLGGNNPWMYYTFFMVAIFLLFVGGSLLYVEKLDRAEYD